MNKPINVAVVKADGSVEEKKLDFEGCRQTVGGDVEPLRLAPGVWAYVNENGIAEGLPRNELATRFCRGLGDNIAIHDFIKGTMVVTGTNGDRPVTAKALTLLLGLAAKAVK